MLLWQGRPSFLLCSSRERRVTRRASTSAPAHTILRGGATAGSLGASTTIASSFSGAWLGIHVSGPRGGRSPQQRQRSLSRAKFWGRLFAWDALPRRSRPRRNSSVLESVRGDTDPAARAAQRFRPRGNEIRSSGFGVLACRRHGAGGAARTSAHWGGRVTEICNWVRGARDRQQRSLCVLRPLRTKLRREIISQYACCGNERP